MNEDKRREEILAAEAAIRELAHRMAEASDCTKQADMARSTLESAIRSLEERNAELRALIEFEKKAAEDERRSLSQVRESLDSNAKRLQETIESFNIKLYDLSCDINETQKQLFTRSDDLETFISEIDQKSRESVDAMLSNLSNNISRISGELLFVVDQNEASTRRVLALEQSIKELSGGFQDIGNRIVNNSEGIEALKMGIIEYNERLISLEQASAVKTSGLSYRLRSALIGGLGAIMAVVILKFV